MAQPVYKIGIIFSSGGGGVFLGSRSGGAPSASSNLYTISEQYLVARNFCGFCDFSSDPENKVPANRKYSKHFSRKNLLQSKYSQQPMTHVLLISSNLNSLHIYSTKKSCLFNHNLSLLSRNKTVN